MKKNATASTGHGTGVLMEPPLARRLRHRFPRLPRRTGALQSPLERSRMAKGVREKEQRRGGKSYFYQLVQYAIAKNKEAVRAKRAAKRGEKYETPRWLTEFKASVFRAGRALLGKR
jgi:hypothetical protein